MNIPGGLPGWPPDFATKLPKAMMTSPIRDLFLQGMSRAAQTVNIVTTDGPAGRAGVTVSAMVSVSADTPKPTLLVCVHHLASAADRIIGNGYFCVNILHDDQAFIADTFAGRFRDQVADKFACAEWVNMPSGAPRVVDPLVAFDCKISQHNRVGTHHIFMGEVQDVFLASHGTPLIYAHRAYGSPTRIDAAALGNRDAVNRLSIACFHSFGPFVLPELLRRLTEAAPVDLTLIEGDQRRVQESLRSGEAELALLYDLNLPDDLQIMPLFDLTPYVLLAASHPLAAKPSLTPADLAPHPMVLLNAPPSTDYFLSILRDAGVEPQVAFRSSSIEMVRGLVGQGLGYALLATRPAAMQSYDGKPLTARPLAEPTKRSRVVLAARKGIRLSPLAEQFTFLARHHFDLDA